MAKMITLLIRASAEEKEAWRKEAYISDIPLSRWIRLKLNGQSEELPVEAAGKPKSRLELGRSVIALVNHKYEAPPSLEKDPSPEPEKAQGSPPPMESHVGCLKCNLKVEPEHVVKGKHRVCGGVIMYREVQEFREPR